MYDSIYEAQIANPEADVLVIKRNGRVVSEVADDSDKLERFIAGDIAGLNIVEVEVK